MAYEPTFPSSSRSPSSQEMMKRMMYILARQLSESNPEWAEYADLWPAITLLYRQDQIFFVKAKIPPNFELYDEQGKMWPQIQKRLTKYKAELEADSEHYLKQLKQQLMQQYAKAQLTFTGYLKEIENLGVTIQEHKEQLIAEWMVEMQEKLYQVKRRYVSCQAGLLGSRGEKTIEEVKGNMPQWFSMILGGQKRKKPTKKPSSLTGDAELDQFFEEGEF